MSNAASLHRRQHRSILADQERRVLVWMGHRVPRVINADHLSLLGLVSMAIVGVGFAAMRLSPSYALMVTAGLLANWLGDSLDGTVARVRGHERPRFGFYVDHVIDLAGTAMLFAGLAGSGLMTPVLALAVLAAYLLVSAESYLATHAAGVFRMSSFGIGPTELRIVLAIGAICAARQPSVTLAWLGSRRLFDVGGGVALAGLLIVFVDSALRQTRRLYRADRVIPALAIVALLASSSLAGAQPSARTLATWNAVVAGTETRVEAHEPPAFDRQAILAGGLDVVPLPIADAQGRVLDVPDGTIQHWRGGVLIPRVRLVTLLDALETTPPRQADVVASRILSRQDDRVQVYLRLVRRMIVTATYDTTHEMTFHRMAPGVATGRSEMLAVAEVVDAGTPTEHLRTARQDRGFLWRLNSYWWYEETAAGVVAVLESLTLSRDVPWVLRPVAAPIVRRIAVESMTSALDGLRQRFR